MQSKKETQFLAFCAHWQKEEWACSCYVILKQKMLWRRHIWMHFDYHFPTKLCHSGFTAVYQIHKTGSEVIWQWLFLSASFYWFCAVYINTPKISKQKIDVGHHFYSCWMKMFPTDLPSFTLIINQMSCFCAFVLMSKMNFFESFL